MEVLAAFTCDGRVLRLGEKGPDFLLEKSFKNRWHVILAGLVNKRGSFDSCVLGGPWLFFRFKDSRGYNDIWRTNNRAIPETRGPFRTQCENEVNC